MIEKTHRYYCSHRDRCGEFDCNATITGESRLVFPAECIHRPHWKPVLIKGDISKGDVNIPLSKIYGRLKQMYDDSETDEIIALLTRDDDETERRDH